VKFAENIVVEASKEQVRAFLEDVPAVAQCVPGVEGLQAVEPDVYEGKVRVRIGPLGMSIAGRARLEREGDIWRLHGEGRDGRVGAGAKAVLEATLAELAPARTEVRIDADVQFSGRLAELGQPLIKRKAEAMVQEFAQNLRKAFAK
jgi:carbon monoxide dehydrogenase subunit G